MEASQPGGTSDHITNLQPAQAKKDFIYAIFVIEFDLKKGNSLAWQYPDNVDLGAIEFKAMPSGSHNSTEDYVYFGFEGSLFGISCFNLRKDRNAVRGMYARSIGLICGQYTSLYEHKSFLENQAKLCCDKLEDFDYQMLQTHFTTYRKRPSLTGQSVRKLTMDSSFDGRATEALTIAHPDGCFRTFVDELGPKIFALWRMAMLSKRILFLCYPPVGLACNEVYSTCLLALRTCSSPTNAERIVPLFYVNLMDTQLLEKSKCYAACVTEHVFADKTQIYDVLVKTNTSTNKKTIESTAGYASVVTCSKKDTQRYGELNAIRTHESEDALICFFLDLNNTLFGKLEEIAASEESVLTALEMTAMGFDPVTDYVFLKEFVGMHFPTVQVQSLGLCC